MLTFFAFIVIQDPIYCILFPDMICKAKINYKCGWKEIYDFFKVVFIGAVILATSLNFGFINGRYSTFLETYFQVAMEYWIMVLIKDWAVLAILHPLMHKPENYWIHKYHHSFGVEVQAHHAFSIDFLDLIIENNIGFFLYFFFQWLILGKVEVHILSILYLGGHDIKIHSLNPYASVHCNPIMEYWHKPIIEHNLHHMIQRDYYVFDSFRHIWDSKKFDYDLAKYNEICKTKISFDLWVDMDANIAY